MNNAAQRKELYIGIEIEINQRMKMKALITTSFAVIFTLTTLMSSDLLAVSTDVSRLTAPPHKGTSNGGGSNATDERQAHVESLTRYIEQNLITEEITFFQNIAIEKVKRIADVSLRNAFSAILFENNLIEILKTHTAKELYYISHNGCPKKKDEYAKADLNVPICFDVDQMADRRPLVSESDILRLAIHARAHQHGWAVKSDEEQENKHDVFNHLPNNFFNNQIDIKKVSKSGVQMDGQKIIALLNQKGVDRGLGGPGSKLTELRFRDTYIEISSPRTELGSFETNPNWSTTVSQKYASYICSLYGLGPSLPSFVTSSSSNGGLQFKEDNDGIYVEDDCTLKYATSFSQIFCAIPETFDIDRVLNGTPEDPFGMFPRGYQTSEKRGVCSGDRAKEAFEKYFTEQKRRANLNSNNQVQKPLIENVSTNSNNLFTAQIEASQVGYNAYPEGLCIQARAAAGDAARAKCSAAGFSKCGGPKMGAGFGNTMVVSERVVEQEFHKPFFRCVGEAIVEGSN